MNMRTMLVKFSWQSRLVGTPHWIRYTCHVPAPSPQRTDIPTISFAPVQGEPQNKCKVLLKRCQANADCCLNACRTLDLLGRRCFLFCDGANSAVEVFKSKDGAHSCLRSLENGRAHFRFVSNRFKESNAFERCLCRTKTWTPTWFRSCSIQYTSQNHSFGACSSDSIGNDSLASYAATSMEN
jgi:hypothetical protein